MGQFPPAFGAGGAGDHSPREGVSFMLLVDYFVRGVDALNEFMGKAVSWLMLALIASVCLDLFSRYFTGRSTDWAFDINYMLYGTSFMIAGAYTLKHDGHVRVDVLFMKFSPKTRAWLEMFFYIVLMFPLCVFLLEATWIDFVMSVENREVSIVSSWHPPIYYYKFVMPLSFALLLLQSIVQFLRNIFVIAGRVQNGN